MDEPWITYELWQGGICVAGASGPESTKDRLQGEIMHYARQYAEDGPCEVRGPIVNQLFADDCQ
jgi:hypothetical protein